MGSDFLCTSTGALNFPIRFGQASFARLLFFPRISPPFFVFVFWGPLCFPRTRQERCKKDIYIYIYIYICWGPNSSLGLQKLDYRSPNFPQWIPAAHQVLGLCQVRLSPWVVETCQAPMRSFSRSSRRRRQKALGAR